MANMKRARRIGSGAESAELVLRPTTQCANDEEKPSSNVDLFAVRILLDFDKLPLRRTL